MQMPQTICHHCGEKIPEGSDRAIAIVIGFPRHFCKSGENVELSCYYLWSMKRAAVRSK